MTDQLDFTVADTATAHARATDPATSDEAAADVTPRLTANRGAVLALFRAYHPKALTHMDLIRNYALERAQQANHAPDRLTVDLPKQSESGLRSRCAELVRLGELRAVDTVTLGKRRHTRWGLP